MGFLLAVLSFVVAEEVVELEPVQSGTYDCNLLAPAIPDATDEARCNANPYCFFDNNDKKCIDDPCLQTALSSTSGCTPTTCLISTVSNTSDCAGGSGSFCRSPLGQGVAEPAYDYCFWAQLRDGACPDSVCQVGDINNANQSKKCIRKQTGGEGTCQYLATEDECKLSPKCVWKDSCQQDPCFVGSLDRPCATWLNPDDNGDPAIGPDGALKNGDCALYQPYKTDGTVASYCVYKSLNKSPNLCYFLNPATSAASSTSTDFPTFPSPKCTDNITACDSNPSGECSTKVNSKGAFAGLYCGDATHGAANILHVPSLVVFLLAFIIVSKFTL